MAPITGVIFDLDGTLVSSSLNFTAIREQIGCPQSTDILTFIDNIKDHVARQHAIDKVVVNELKDAHSAEIIPGVIEMLAELHHTNVPTAVVTRNCRVATDIKLQRHNLEFEIVLTRECAPPKPDPTALLNIANDWDIDPQHLVYVGDYIYDIQTAENAGMRSVLMDFSDEPTSEKPTWFKQATWCYSDYSQLLNSVAALNS